MEFIDTPNPNAKKIEVVHSYEVSIYLVKEGAYSPEINYLLSHDGVKSIFTGPNFLTVSKNENYSWEDIIKDLKDNS
jgi:Scaffold protein Nfu/NifU N terminal.|tara:strand:+ start:133 stop:363 length:231 start_codon:yes stop_codon:yes gene_type:complete